MTRSLAELLVLAGSADWSDRVVAAECLGGRPEPEARAAIDRLLEDDADTAPIQAAAETLAAAGEPEDLDQIIRGMANAEDEVVDHLRSFVGRLAPTQLEAVRARARTVRFADDAKLRAGAEELLS